MKTEPALSFEDLREVGKNGAPRYKLPLFEGPLDLLLFLINKDELEITDIPILEITEQYDAYLERMRELDLEVAAEFVLMAATLIHIKSRMLLPLPKDKDGAEEWEDPRKPLVEQLMEYRRFKDIAAELIERQESSVREFSRTAGLGAEGAFHEISSLDIGIYDLIASLQEVLKRAADRKERLVFAPEVSLAGRINYVLEKLEAHGSLLFTEFLGEAASRLEVVVTFLAVLELAKQRVVRLFQRAPLQPFRVVLSV